MIFSKKNILMLLAVLALLPVSANDTIFTIANTLQSNMIVQHGKPLTVWGAAPAGTKINVAADWLKKTVTATANNDNEWTAELPVPSIRKGDFKEHVISVSAGKVNRVLKNILFGDVWLCSGQSNMDMTIKPFLPWLLGALNYHLEIENADYPQIRLFDVETDFKAEPQNDCKGTWKVCTPQNAADFSAAAYFFARQLFRSTGIPQGLITSAVGASSCQAWTSRDTLTADKILFEKYLFPYDTSAVSKEKLDATVTFEKVVRPTLFYNAMIHPLRKLHLSGALWYQGESNKDDGAKYARLCSAMIKNWRDLFNNALLPFFYVQVAPYNWQQHDTTSFNYAIFREAQAKIEKSVPGSGMALTMDIADPNDIHPRNKQDVGYRLAKLALATKYGIKNIVSRGPEYKSHEVIKDTMIVSFTPESVGSGLATNDGLAPKHFYVAGSNGVFHYANARIADNHVYLFSPVVKDPVAIRYAFTNFPVTNFENSDGFPAIPFRTDTSKP